MFEVNNKNTRTTSMRYFRPFSSLYIVDFEQVNNSWVRAFYHFDLYAIN